MLEFAYFIVKCGMTVFIIKYIAETIQVLGGGRKASDNSLLREYIRSRLAEKKDWNREETTTRWKD